MSTVGVIASCALNHLWGCILFLLLPLFCPHSEPCLMAFVLLQREFRLKITICYSAWPLAMAGSWCQRSDIIRLMTNKPSVIPAPPGQRAPYFTTQLSVKWPNRLYRLSSDEDRMKCSVLLHFSFISGHQTASAAAHFHQFTSLAEF